jgi:protein arginine N-methyltransferase 7
MRSEDATPWWGLFIDEIERHPASQRADRLAKLALMLAKRGERDSAADIALRAWRHALESASAGQSETLRRALGAVTPRYHVSISTDAQRLIAWQAALADVVKPGMLVLEIGAGSGILAMLAARAGAEVVSCEKDPILAAIAEATVDQNRLSDRIRIVAKACADLRIPNDLPRPADLLMLDLFGDGLFNFRPFAAIRSVGSLLAPNVVVLPSRVSLEGALSEFRRWHRMIPGNAAGFDLGPLGCLASSQIGLDAADPDILVRSAAETMVSATLPHQLPASSGALERSFRSNGGHVNGVALWLRLELTQNHILEARPGSAPRGFYARPRFHAFAKSFETHAGQECPVRIGWENDLVTLDADPSRVA